MANITATFTLVDRVSEQLERIAEAGSRMVEQLEQANTTASQTFSGMETGATNVASQINNVTTSVDSLSGSIEHAAQSASTLSNSCDENAAAASELSESAEQAADANEDLADSAEEAGNSVQEMGSTGADAMNELSNAITAIGIVAMLKEMAEGFIECSQAAAEFESAIQKIGTIADTSKVPLTQFSADIMQLSQQTGISVNELSEATYQAISASVDTSDAVSFTATATQLAAGGFTKSATAVDVLTTALNAYGLGADKASSISDMLITTQNLGKTSVDQLASSVGKVIPLAAAYGVEMDNLSAAYAELTKGGISTAESGTYLKSMINELGDSASKVSGVLVEQTGQSFTQLMAQGYSLGDVLAVLGEAVNGDTGAFNELWSSSEAGIGALAMFNSGADQFNATLDAMRGSVGATETAYNKMTDTTAHASQELANAVENLKIAIGQELNPLMETLANMGTNVLNSFTSFAQAHPEVVQAVTAIAIGIGATAAAIVGFTFAANVAIPALKKFGMAVWEAMGPVGLIVAAIGGLVAAFMALDTMWENNAMEELTGTSQTQANELEALNSRYEEACAKFGETSEEASRLKNQVDELSTSFEANKQTLGEFVAESEALCDSVDQIRTTYDEAMSATESQEVGTFALIQKYDDLASKANKTQAEELQLKAITDELAKSFPDVAEGMESATGSAEKYVEALKTAAKAEFEKQKQQQKTETYFKALEKQAELEDQIADAVENVRLAKASMDGSDWNHLWTPEKQKTLEAAEEQLENLNGALSENNEIIGECEQGFNAMAQAAEEYAQSAEGIANTTFAGFEEEIMNLCARSDEVVATTTANLEGLFGLFDKAEIDTQATLSAAQEAANSQLEYMTKFDENLNVISGAKDKLIADLGVTEEQFNQTMSHLQEATPEMAGLAESMKQAIEEGDMQAVADLIKTQGEIQTKQDEIVATMEKLLVDVDAGLAQIEQRMNDAIGKLTLDKEASTAAQSTINAYIAQIRAGQDSAVAAAQSIVDAVKAKLSSAPTAPSGGGGSTTTAKPATKKGNARGTLYAEPEFIAGERGPELVARPAAKYATGTTNSTDFFIAGENGPELIIGEQGSTVFPASETDRLISALNTAPPPLQIQSPINTSEKGNPVQEKKITLDIAGNGTLQISGGMDRETVVDIMQDHMRPMLLNLVQTEIYEEGDRSYNDY